jgi:hypothetical protein
LAERRRDTAGVLTATIGLVAAAAAFAVAIPPQPTSAAWQSTTTLDVSATAVQPGRPTGLSCVSGSGGLFSPVPFTWTAPAGTAPSGYTLKWTGAATGSSSWPGTSGSVPASALLGNITVSVHADYGSWQSAAGSQTRTVSTVVIGALWFCS